MTSKDLQYHKTYLRMAIEWSSLSKSKRKQVGSLIVKDGMIISDGFNGAPTGFPNDCEDLDGSTYWHVLHAEANAILKCAKHGISCKDATLYLTMSPCKECSKLIIQASIKRVVYYLPYRDLDGLKMLKSVGVDVIQIADV
jgi:dCMP deaminase